MLLMRPEASPYTRARRCSTTLRRARPEDHRLHQGAADHRAALHLAAAAGPRARAPGLCYRAGFLPEERREIEATLLSGELDGVISTSALELGIDIGGLDACILVGYPGSMMATWQRSGRVGRGGRESLTALVALPDALDQYLLDHPDELLDRPCEPLVFDPGNEPVARAHLALRRRRDCRCPDADAR